MLCYQKKVNAAPVDMFIAEQDRHQLSEKYDLPAFRGESSGYMIATTPRSGSHYLGHLLSSTKLIGSPLEYFNPGHFRLWKEVCSSTDASNVVDFIRSRRTGHAGWFGFKAHWPQYEFFQSLGLDATRHRPVKFIWLKRHDVLAQAVSFAIAEQTGRWIYLHRAIRPATYQFDHVAAKLYELYLQERKWEQFFASKNEDPLILYYEEVVAHPSVKVGEILSYLGIEITSSAINITESTQQQRNAMNERWKNVFIQDLNDRAAGRGVATRIVRRLQRNRILRWICQK